MSAPTPAQPKLTHDERTDMSDPQAEILAEMRSEITLLCVKLDACADGAKGRAEDGNDVLESLARADAFAYVRRMMARLERLAAWDGIVGTAGGS